MARRFARKFGVLSPIQLVPSDGAMPYALAEPTSLVGGGGLDGSNRDRYRSKTRGVKRFCHRRFWCIWGFWAGEGSLADRRPTGCEPEIPCFRPFPATDESYRTRVCGRRRAIVRRCTRTFIIICASASSIFPDLWRAPMMLIQLSPRKCQSVPANM
jgi:hypothetical protein